VIKTVATSAAVAYGAYRLARWYWKEEEEKEKNTSHVSERERPLEQNSTAPSPQASSSLLTSSWLSVATDWLVDAAAATTSSLSTTTAPTQNTTSRQKTQRPTSFHHPPITGTLRRQRLMHCRQKTITAFTACLPALQGVVEELTSTSQATRQLKELRKMHKEVAGKRSKQEEDSAQVQLQQHQQQQQDELWKHIVIENTTRMMASSYTYALLLLSLTVQLHWISGNRELLLQEGQQQLTSSTELAQSLLLQSHQYLVADGIPLLVSTIRRSVESIMVSDWTRPTQFMSVQDVEKLLYRQLPFALKYGGTANSGSTGSLGRSWVRFVLPDEECFDPIWDVCSSPVWEDALEQILEKLWYKVLRDDDTDGWKRLFDCTLETENEMHTGQRPVAKIVAQFKKSSNLLFTGIGKDDATPKSSNNTALLISLQKLPTVLELGEVSFQRHK
jgi:hypothetical protein